MRRASLIDCGCLFRLCDYTRAFQSSGLQKLRPYAVLTSDECKICGLHRPCGYSHENAARRNRRCYDLGKHLVWLSRIVERMSFIRFRL
jgi:hypothetical protein